MPKSLLVAVALLVTLASVRSLYAAPATQGAMLTGRVLDPKGKPIADAQITAQGPSGGMVKSDAEGNYSFNNIRTAGEYRIGVRAEGFIEIEDYREMHVIQLSPQSQAKRDITMQPGAVVRVKVLDLVGNPVPTASVDLMKTGGDDRYNRYSRRMSTDAAGRATFAVAPSPTPYVAIATMKEHEPTSARITVPALDKPQEIELTVLPGTPIKGIAMCKDGKPAAGWEMVAYPEWWASNYIPPMAKIDNNGNFTLTDVGPGKYNLHIHMGRSLRQVSTMTFPPSSQPIRIDLPYDSPAAQVKFAGKVRVTGSVQPDYISVEAMSLGADHSWHHAQVNFSGARTARRSTTAPATAQAAGRTWDGTFTFEGLPAGSYRLSFNSPTIETKVLEKVEVPSDLPVVELKARGRMRLSGTVTDAATGKPVPQFSFRVQKHETIGEGPNYVQEGNWKQVSRPDGKYDAELVGPGVYQVQAQAEGFAWVWSDRVRVESSGGPAKADIKLTKGGSIAGLVVDAEGKPVAGAKVIPLSKAKTTAMRGENRFEGDAGAVTTDSRGIFTLKLLTPGDEMLKVKHESFAPIVVENLKVVDGQTADAGTVKLAVGGRVEGVVYDDKGKPSPAVTLYFQDENGYGGSDDERAGRLATLVTDEQGKFKAEHLPEQPIYVVVDEGWKRMGMIRRVVRPMEGKTAKLDFGGAVPLKGRLMLDGKPVASRRVNLSLYSQHFGPVMMLIQTDSEGRFTFMGVPAGRFTLYSEANSERSEWMTIGDFEVTGQPQDLGDVVPDVGEVVVTVSADDPADAKSTQYMSITTDVPGRPYQNHIGQLAQEKNSDQWRGQNVPVGKFLVQTNTNEQVRIIVNTPFERKAGEKSTAVKVHVPRRSGELNVKLTGTAGEGEQRWANLRREDRRISVYVGAGRSDDKPLKLPPGKYLVMEGSTDQLRNDIPPIEVKEGSVASVEIDIGKTPDTGAQRTMHIGVWDSTGVLIAGAKVKLVDASGKEASGSGDGSLGPAFTLAPGKYQATVERPGKPPHTQEIEVDARKPDTRTRRGGWHMIHLVVP